MAVTSMDRTRGLPKSRRKDAWEFWLIYWASFLVFLVVAVLRRLAPSVWRAPVSPGRPAKSVIVEAKEAASTSIPYAFMG